MVALFLVISMMLSVCGAFALEIDLSKYSKEELIELNALIAKEMLDRGFEKQATVPVGKYIIGQDLPAGTYTLKPAKDGFKIRVYSDVNHTGDYEWIHSDYVSSDEYIGKIELLDGQVLEIDANVVFILYTGIDFF